jgi:8-amino-7-oxononanoate synthase
VVRFEHNDLDHLRRLLEEHRTQDHSRTIIVTESVFSMDGDRAEMDSLVSLADEFQALLVVDEAHATGLFGPRGMGLTVGRGVDLAVGTFGKALGVFGAYVACGRKMRDYLVNCCAGFLYTTALPPAVLGAVDAALDLVPHMDRVRARLQEEAEELRRRIRGLGCDTGGSTTQIVPLMVGQGDAALKLSAALRQRGILAAAIRPPTVPEGRARLRLTLSAAHTEAQLSRLVDALRAGVSR